MAEKNTIFAIAVQPVDTKISHPFGGLVDNFYGDYRYLHYGVNYGSYGGFTDDDIITDRMGAHHVVLLPISSDAVRRYKSIIESLRSLQLENRLPFYLSARFAINPYFENTDDTPYYLDGKPVVLPDPYGSYIGAQQRLYDPYGDYSEDPEVLSPPGLKRIRTNCATFFDLVTHMAGIGLDGLDPHWFNSYRSTHTEFSINALLQRSKLVGRTEKHNVAVIKKAVYPPVMRTQGRVEYDVSTVDLNDSSAVIVEAQVDPKENVPFKTLMAAAAGAFKGFEGLEAFLGSAAPLTTDPLPIPAYLKDELDRAGERPFAVYSP